MTRAAPIGTVLVLLSAACQAPPPAELTAAEREAIATEIIRVSGEMMTFTAPEQYNEMLAYWADDADSFFVGEPAVLAQGVGIVTTRDNMREWMSGFVGRRQSTNFDVQENHVAVLSPDVAVQVTRGTFSITNNEGATGPNYPHSSTTVWVRENDAWKMVHFHQSWTDTPVEEAGEATGDTGSN